MKKKVLLTIIFSVVLIIILSFVYKISNLHIEFIDNSFDAVKTWYNTILEGSNEVHQKEGIKITKTEIKDKNGENTETLLYTLTQVSEPYSTDDSTSDKYYRFDNGILTAGEKSLTLFNTDGEIEWNVKTNISLPYIKCNKSYILLWEANSQKAAVYDKNKLLYSVQTNDNIVNAYISENGECVLVTKIRSYKNAVSVYNKKGQLIFSRNIGKNHVCSAAISSKRKLAISMLDYQDSLKSIISFYKLDKEDEIASAAYENSIFYNLEFSGEKLIAYSDNKIISLKKNAKEEWVYDFEDRTLQSFSYAYDDVRLLLFDNGNNAQLSLLSLSGKEIEKINTEIIPICCDIYDNNILYTDMRNIYVAKKNGALLAKYPASRDIKQAYFVDKNSILVVYNSSIEFLKLKKGD